LTIAATPLTPCDHICPHTPLLALLLALAHPCINIRCAVLDAQVEIGVIETG
jgi:hypothetical protein